MKTIASAAHESLIRTWIRMKQRRRELRAQGVDVLTALHTDERVAPGSAGGEGEPGADGDGDRRLGNGE